MRILGSFNTANYGSIRVTFTNANEGQINGILSGSFFPFVSGTVEGITYQSAPAYITEAINDQFAFATHFEMGYDYSGNFFWISSSAGSITFTNEARRVFGFTRNFSSAAPLYITSSVKPYFIYESKEICYTKYSDTFEDYSPQRQSVADDGRVFAISSDDNANYDYVKFTLTNEDKWKVFSYASSSLYPYTWQQHVEEMRSFRPWIIYPSGLSGSIGYEQRQATVKFKGDNANFKPSKMFVDVYSYWDCPVYAKLLSTGSNG